LADELYRKNIIATKLINFQMHTSHGNTNTCIYLMTNEASAPSLTMNMFIHFYKTLQLSILFKKRNVQPRAVI